MSTRMDGIHQPTLFSRATLRVDVVVSANNRYRVLAESLPWIELASVANQFRSKLVDINCGRPLDLRLQIGAFIAQSMNGWTDRETEENVALNAGVRLLCGLEQSSDTTDHTSIATFRGQLGSFGVERLNQIIVKTAKNNGFTGSELCASDTTVQEAPICYPTEVGHMKNISEKLLGIGSKIRKKMSGAMNLLANQAQKLFTNIRLFARGKSDKALEKKKKLSKRLHKTVTKMRRLVQTAVDQLGSKAQLKYQGSLAFYKKMLSQIRVWQETGFHPRGKIVSLWLQDVRSILRGKTGKMTEFGRRWIITRLKNGYIIGTVCKHLGAGSDTGLMPEILTHFKASMGKMPKLVVYDRGGDSPKNHRTLKRHNITDAIFCKGQESQPNLGRNTAAKARRERALTEATIATIKHPRYGFNKPRARSSEGCVLKGQAAIFGANLMHLIRDISMARV